MNEITIEIAQTIIDAARRRAEKIKVAENIAIVDSSGNLKAFARMDGAWLGSIDIAMRKARTSRYFDMPTAEIGKMSKPNGPLYGIEVSNGGTITFGGGIPLEDENGEVIGAIGVSGGTVKEDETVANAGVDAGEDMRKGGKKKMRLFA